MHDVGHMLGGFTKLRALAGRDGAIIPGHDPLVMQRCPAASEAGAGIIARLDAGPALHG